MNNNKSDQSETTAKPSSEQGSSLWGRVKQHKFIVITVAVILALVIGWVVYSQFIKAKPFTVNVRSSNFDKTASDANTTVQKTMSLQLLKGDSTGFGMSFRVPLSDFIYTDSPINKALPPFPKDFSVYPDKPISAEGNSVNFGQRIFLSANSNEVTFQGLVAAKIVPKTDQASFSSTDYFKNLIAKLSFNSAKPNASGLQLNITPAGDFKNASVKGDAQLNNISTELPSGVDPGVVKHLKGQLVELKGKRANYYLLIAATDSNWDNNPKTWQAVKDSIKIDQ